MPVLGTRALPGHTRAFLKIQEGCNYICTYCIIPSARGLSRSVGADEVMEQVRSLADAGYLEVVLTGIHLGGYGRIGLRAQTWLCCWNELLQAV